MVIYIYATSKFIFHLKQTFTRVLDPNISVYINAVDSTASIFDNIDNNTLLYFL